MMLARVIQIVLVPDLPPGVLTGELVLPLNHSISGENVLFCSGTPNPDPDRDNLIQFELLSNIHQQQNMSVRRF